MAVEEGEVGGGLLANLTPRQRIIAIGSFVAIVILLIALVVLLMGQKGDDKFVVIMRDLPPKSVGEVVEKLKEQRITYEVRDEGRSVAVEKAKKDEAIIGLSMVNLPHDGRVGFEIFGDKANGMLSTDFEKKVALQRAMNGELSRLVQKMNGVERAEVMIVVPEPQLFQEQQLPTTASVLLRLSSGGGFSQEQIESITNLVSSAVPGLKPENVTISDVNGKVLAAGHGSGETESSKAGKELNKQFEIKRDVEHKLESKIVEMLEKVVGPGHVKPKVSVSMNFDAIQKRIRNMTPVLDNDKKPMPIAVKSMKERNREPKGGDAINGAPGVTTNLSAQTATGGANLQQQQSAPNNPLNGTGTNPNPIPSINGSSPVPNATPLPGVAINDKDSEQQTMNFNNEEQLVTPAMGSIQKMTIAVTYQYGNPKPEGAEDAGETAVKKLSNDDIMSLVKGTVGFDDKRGDTITAKEVVFDDTIQKALSEQMSKMDAAKRLIPWWVALIAGLVALVVGAGIGGALLSKKAPPPELAGGFAPVPGEYAAVPAPGTPPGGAIPPPGAAVPEVAAPQDRVEVARAPVTPPPDNPFGFLYGIEAETVANLLSSERLPTLVAVLAQLDPSQADEVITLLNPEVQSEVRSRLANNPVLPPMTQKMVSQSLKKRLQSLSAA
ncbi:MAG: flagellar basal-body MS-ring/collar protein FliF [Candidatus Sericytochromatia bacterium]